MHIKYLILYLIKNCDNRVSNQQRNIVALDLTITSTAKNFKFIERGLLNPGLYNYGVTGLSISKIKLQHTEKTKV